MKHLYLLFILITSYKGYAQRSADAILGKWMKTPKEDLIIEVYTSADKYKGKISWAKNNDKKKPLGFVILDDLKYNRKSKKWVNGKIHDPRSGNTYSAEVKLKSNGNLEVKGFMGVKFLGTSRIFKRIKQ
jgi:uncharacterized protein (DUF2147 family)